MITELKISWMGFRSRLEQTEGRISDMWTSHLDLLGQRSKKEKG